MVEQLISTPFQDAIADSLSKGQKAVDALLRDMQISPLNTEQKQTLREASDFLSGEGGIAEKLRQSRTPKEFLQLVAEHATNAKSRFSDSSSAQQLANAFLDVVRSQMAQSDIDYVEAVKYETGEKGVVKPGNITAIALREYPSSTDIVMTAKGEQAARVIADMLKKYGMDFKSISYDSSGQSALTLENVPSQQAKELLVRLLAALKDKHKISAQDAYEIFDRETVRGGHTPIELGMLQFNFFDLNKHSGRMGPPYLTAEIDTPLIPVTRLQEDGQFAGSPSEPRWKTEKSVRIDTRDDSSAATLKACLAETGIVCGKTQPLTSTDNIHSFVANAPMDEVVKVIAKHKLIPESVTREIVKELDRLRTGFIAKQQTHQTSWAGQRI